MEPVKYFYCLSSIHRERLELSYPDYARWSIQTLNQVVDNPEIVVCFTPPVDPADVESLKQYNPYIKENIPAKVRNPNSIRSVTDSKIMNKVHVGGVQGELIVEPDVNVMFIKDPAPLMQGEFDIAGRVLKEKKSNLCFISCRFLIFKNNVQSELAVKWLEEYNNGKCPENIEYGLYNAAVGLGLNIKNIDDEMGEYVFHTHGGYQKWTK